MPELSFIGLQIKFGERNKVISAEAVNLPPIACEQRGSSSRFAKPAPQVEFIGTRNKEHPASSWKTAQAGSN